MPATPDPSQHVRRVTLPSGRAIEVVYFESGHNGRAPVDLHVCEACGSELVYPVRWAEADLVHWEVERRCPECEHRTLDLYDQATVDRFDAHLDESSIALAEDLHRFERANMEEEVERFSRALAFDALLPEDF